MHAERPWRPHFEAQYNPPPLKAFTPARELMLMISPRLRLIIPGATALETKNTLFKLVFTTRSQSSSDFSCAGPKTPMPALFTRMVTGPRADSVFATRASTSAGRVTSATYEKTRPPKAATSALAAFNELESRPQIDTAAPSEARRTAMARPIPRLPPVTRARASLRGFLAGVSALALGV